MIQTYLPNDPANYQADFDHVWNRFAHDGAPDSGFGANANTCAVGVLAEERYGCNFQYRMYTCVMEQYSHMQKIPFYSDLEQMNYSLRLVPQTKECRAAAAQKYLREIAKEYNLTIPGERPEQPAQDEQDRRAVEKLIKSVTKPVTVALAFVLALLS